jgi:histidinol-phosphate aminotransferase
MARGIIPREVVNYGLPEYLRISLGTTEENHLLLAALTDFITQRKSA